MKAVSWNTLFICLDAYDAVVILTFVVLKLRVFLLRILAEFTWTRLGPKYFGFDSHRFSLLGRDRFVCKSGEEVFACENTTFIRLGGLNDIRGHATVSILDILAKLCQLFGNSSDIPFLLLRRLIFRRCRFGLLR